MSKAAASKRYHGQKPKPDARVEEDKTSMLRYYVLFPPMSEDTFRGHITRSLVSSLSGVPREMYVPEDYLRKVHILDTWYGSKYIVTSWYITPLIATCLWPLGCTKR